MGSYLGAVLFVVIFMRILRICFALFMVSFLIFNQMVGNFVLRVRLLGFQ